MRPKRIFALALILGAALSAARPAPAAAQDKLSLTLDEAIRIALRQNPAYQAAKAAEAGASSMVREAVSGFFPTLSAQGSDILDKKVFTIEIPSFVPGEPPQRVKFDFTRTYQLTLNFSLPIYAGGRITSGLKQANYNLASTRESIRLAQQETVLNVKRAFYGYLLAKKAVEVSEEAVGLADKFAARVKSLFDVGLASRFDLLRSEVQAANLKPQLIRARNAQAAAELGLKVALGVDQKTVLDVRGDLAVQAVEVDTDANLAQALASRPELGQMRFQRMMAAEGLKMSKAAYLPTVGIGGAYNYWSNFLNFKRNNWESYYQINLVVGFNLFSGFLNSAKVGESRALLRQIDYTQKGLEEAVKLEVQQAILNLRQARESLLSQERNIEEAQEAVRIAELNFAEGLATNLDVSSAQVALSQARTNHAQALYDYAVALAELEKSAGVSQDKYETAVER